MNSKLKLNPNPNEVRNESKLIVNTPESSDALEPIPFDQEAANRIVGYLGDRSWAEVFSLMQDIQRLSEAVLVNYHIAISCQKGNDK